MKKVLLFLFAFGMLTASAQYKIERLEPMFWWTGFENPDLQVLVYGENIAELTPKIEDYQGVSLRATIRVKNPDYLFLDLNISPQAQPGSFQISFEKDGKQQASYAYNLYEREKGSAQRQGFDASDAIYLITPDRFANGNPENDQIESLRDKLNRKDDYGRHGGDLKGIIDHLDYIENMGFTAIWLNPVLENAMPQASYHGYAITDYYAVDPRYGSNELYKKLSQEAEKRGIKLIMDMVMNHCGSEHWWVKNPPTDDWLHFQEKYQRCNHRRTTLHDPYSSEIDKKMFTDGWFVSVMPDMNQDNPLLANYLIYNSIWWIEYAGLGGVRHDTHPYPGEEFMNRWTCRIMQEYPNFNIVGEEWSLDPVVIAKWQRGQQLPLDFQSCLPSLMDFPLQHYLVKALVENESWGTGLIKLYEILGNDFLYAEPYNMVIFPDNHDMDRFFTQVKQDFDLYKLGMAYLLTTRGIPQIFYGTEILMANQKPGDHGEIRTDFPGGWQGDKTNAFTAENLSNQQEEAQKFMKKLLNWRKQNPVIHSGKLMHFGPLHDGVYVYFRYNEEKKIMVVLNKSKNDKEIPTSRFSEILDSQSTAINIFSGKRFEVGKQIVAPARSPLILEIE